MQSTEPTENDHEEEARSCHPRVGEEEEGPWAHWPISLASMEQRKFNSDEQCLREDVRSCPPAFTHTFTYEHIDTQTDL